MGTCAICGKEKDSVMLYLGEPCCGDEDCISAIDEAREMQEDLMGDWHGRNE